MSIVGDYKAIKARRDALHPDPYCQPVKPYDGLTTPAAPAPFHCAGCTTLYYCNVQLKCAKSAPTTNAQFGRCTACMTPYLCGVASACAKAAPDMGD